MDPTTLARAILMTGNNAYSEATPQTDPGFQNDPRDLMPKTANEIPQEVKKLQELYEVLQTANVKLMKHIVDLQDQLKLKNAESVIFLSDEILFTEAQQRPFFDEWFKKMLGNNHELDDLRAITKQVTKFRTTLQKSLDRWKTEYKIYITLEQELNRVEKPKLDSLPEILELMNAEMERDLATIFHQVEENFKKLSSLLDLKTEEIKRLFLKFDEHEILNKKLNQELEQATVRLEKNTQLQKVYDELVLKEMQTQRELKSVWNETIHLKKELAEKEEALNIIKDTLQQTETERDEAKANQLHLQLRIKQVEDKLSALKEAEEERKYLNECLDRSQKELGATRSQLRVEKLKKSKVIEDAEQSSLLFYESSLAESVVLKKEKALRSEIEMENEALRLKCLSLEEQLKQEQDYQELCARNAFMIKFIHNLDINIQNTFMEQFLHHFK